MGSALAIDEMDMLRRSQDFRFCFFLSCSTIVTNAMHFVFQKWLWRAQCGPV